MICLRRSDRYFDDQGSLIESLMDSGASSRCELNPSRRTHAAAAAAATASSGFEIHRFSTGAEPLIRTVYSLPRAVSVS